MNIQTAAQYMVLGYRVRRVSWRPDMWIASSGLDIEKGTVFRHQHINDNTGAVTWEDIPSVDDMYTMDFADLLGDDYEVITTGIRKQFNKYGRVEYNDETDWDNYVPSKGGWFPEE